MKLYQFGDEIVSVYELEIVYKYQCVTEGKSSVPPMFFAQWLEAECSLGNISELPQNEDTIKLLVSKKKNVYAAVLYKDIHGGTLVEARSVIDKMWE